MQSASQYNKNNINQYINFYRSPSSVLSYLAFFCSCIILSVLCELNRYPWNQNMMLQNVTASIFCIFAGILYVTYTIITQLLKIVLTYAESMYPYHHQYNITEEYPVNIDLDEDEDESHVHNSSRSNLNAMWVDFLRRNAPSLISRNSILRQDRPHYRMPRSIIVSSMYLGGSGAFLAILPLCMWDYTMSASFVCSLIFISSTDAAKIPIDFKTDVDAAFATRALKIMRWAYHLSAFISIVLILWIDTKEEIIYYMIPMFSTPELPTFLELSSDLNGTMSGNLVYEKAVPQNTFLLEGRTGLQYKWPLIFLSASSPIFLRASGGGVGNFFFSMPPSQTLETGLPVSTILAILLLCWHNPNQEILDQMSSLIKLQTAIPLFILAPLCIAAALAFILYGFKKRSAGVISVVLLIILCVRQQISPLHHMKTSLDWISLSSTINTAISTIAYLVYKHKVVMPYHEMRTWNKDNPVVIQEQQDVPLLPVTHSSFEEINIHDTGVLSPKQDDCDTEEGEF